MNKEQWGALSAEEQNVLASKYGVSRSGQNNEPLEGELGKVWQDEPIQEPILTAEVEEIVEEVVEKVEEEKEEEVVVKKRRGPKPGTKYKRKV